MELKDLLSEFLLELQLQNYSSRTIKSYKNNISGLLVFAEKEFDVKKLNQLKHQHIKIYIKNKQDNGLTESYINSIIKGMKAFELNKNILQKHKVNSELSSGSLYAFKCRNMS